MIQGSKLGPILFNIFINDLLVKLNSTKLGVTIERIQITALGYADDIVLIAETPEKLQALVKICEEWSRKNGMKFSTEKCKVLALNVGPKGLAIKLSGKSMEAVSQLKYLGIIISRSRLTTLYGRHIEKMLEKAETRINVIRHMGYQRDGLRPEASIRMYKILVRPILEYAAQVLSYQNYYFTERECAKIQEPVEFIKKMESFQNRALKKIISCPKNTSPAVIRLLTGTMPITGRMDMLKLRYFWKIDHATVENMTHQVYLGLRKNFLKSNKGYIHEVFNLCCKYNRMDIWHGQCPKKINPLSRIRNIVLDYHLKNDEETARRVNCIYTRITVLKAKKYNFEERLTKLDIFQNTDHRSVFLQALLESDKYEKECRNCEQRVRNFTQHGMEECKAVEQQRTLFKMRMKFYDATEKTSQLKLEDIFNEAMSRKCVMKVVCEFLIVIWNWTCKVSEYSNKHLYKNRS